MAKTNKSGTRIYYVPDFLYVYTDSYEMSPTERISEEIPRTKQVGVGRRQGTMISIPIWRCFNREILQS